MSKKEKILFLIILVLGIFVRVYKLYDNPSGIHVDEAGMFVDANMLIGYGTDRYGTNYPVYFVNYGGGQSVMYGYIVALLIKIFGSSCFLIRIPSVAFGILFIIFSYLIGKELMSYKNSLLLMSFVSFCPYFIQASRIGLDCNLFLSFFTIAFYVFIKAIKCEKKYLFVLTGVFYGLCLYTYAISYLVVPFFLLFSFIYLYVIKKIKVKQFLYLLLPVFIISIPLILFLLVNYAIINELKFLIFDIKILPNFRSSEISLKNIPDNLFMIVSLLSYDFLEYNSIKYFGTVYYIFIPFFVIGLIKIFKSSGLEKLVLINFISCYVPLLLVSDININKANVIFFSIVYIIIYGILDIEFKKKFIISFIVLMINFMVFNVYYFNNDTNNNGLFDDISVFCELNIENVS